MGREQTPLGVPGTDVEVLDQLPAVGRLIARAVVTARGRPGAGGDLPARRVMVRVVQQDPARLAAYARVCGFTLRDRVPPTWLHVLTFPLQVHLMAGRDFPFPVAGMVHVANAMTLHRPVDLGERLTLASHAAAMRPHRSGATVDLVGEAWAGHEPVWRGVSTYLVRGVRLPEAVEPAAAEEAGLQPIPPFAQWRLPRDLGRRYARVSGDVNPIHLSSLAARAFGFPRAIAHGMWTHARVLAALEGRLPEAYAARVQFGKPVLLPSTVTFGASAEGERWRVAVTSPAGSRCHLDGAITAAADPRNDAGSAAPSGGVE